MLVDQLGLAVPAQQHGKLSNQVIMPWSLTPFTRNIVAGDFAARTLFRNRSCRFSGFSGIARSNSSHSSPSRLSAMPSAFSLRCKADRSIPMNVSGARDVAGEAADLDLEIFALERLPRFAQRAAHDRLDAALEGQLEPWLSSTSGGSMSTSMQAIRSPGARMIGALDDVAQLADVARPVMRLQRRDCVIGEARRREMRRSAA